jgi:RNA recognition motif-containing protein
LEDAKINSDIFRINYSYLKMSKTPTNKSVNNLDAQEEFKLFLGCIPGSANEEDLLPILLQFASIKNLQLERRKNKKCSGYGKITVDSISAYEALLNSRPLYKERELQILPFLEKTDLVKSQLQFNQRRIVVAQLEKSTTEDELAEYFSRFGAIEKSFVVVNRSDASMLPYGHVVFADEKAAQAAMNQDSHFIGGKQVFVKTHKINLKKKVY